MTFDENSFLVQLYVRKINERDMTIDEVPVLFNLKEEVAKLVI